MQLDSLRLGVSALICAVPLAAGLVGLYGVVVQTGDDLAVSSERTTEQIWVQKALFNLVGRIRDAPQA